MPGLTREGTTVYYEDGSGNRHSLGDIARLPASIVDAVTGDDDDDDEDDDDDDDDGSGELNFIRPSEVSRETTNADYGRMATPTRTIEGSFTIGGDDSGSSNSWTEVERTNTSGANNRRRSERLTNPRSDVEQERERMRIQLGQNSDLRDTMTELQHSEYNTVAAWAIDQLRHRRSDSSAARRWRDDGFEGVMEDVFERTQVAVENHLGEVEYQRIFNHEVGTDPHEVKVLFARFELQSGRAEDIDSTEHEALQDFARDEDLGWDSDAGFRDIVEEHDPDDFYGNDDSFPSGYLDEDILAIKFFHAQGHEFEEDKIGQNRPTGGDLIRMALEYGSVDAALKIHAAPFDIPSRLVRRTDPIEDWPAIAPDNRKSCNSCGTYLYRLPVDGEMTTINHHGEVNDDVVYSDDRFLSIGGDHAILCANCRNEIENNGDVISVFDGESRGMVRIFGNTYREYGVDKSGIETVTVNDGEVPVAAAFRNGTPPDFFEIDNGLAHLGPIVPQVDTIFLMANEPTEIEVPDDVGPFFAMIEHDFGEDSPYLIVPEDDPRTAIWVKQQLRESVEDYAEP